MYKKRKGQGLSSHPILASEHRQSIRQQKAIQKIRSVSSSSNFDTKGGSILSMLSSLQTSMRPSTALSNPTNTSRPLCGRSTPYFPDEGIPLPWIFDSFAADDLTMTYIIAEDLRRCFSKYQEDELYNFENKIFMCEYNDEARTKVVSSRTRGDDPSSETFIISCPIPPDLRSLAYNRDNYADLQISLIEISDLQPHGVVAVVDLPVCAHPLVNEGVVVPRKEGTEKKRFKLAATTWLTGDHFQVVRLKVKVVCKYYATDPYISRHILNIVSKYMKGCI